MQVKYLMDTHTWIWWHMTPTKLSKQAYDLIANSTKHSELLLSAISPWEFSKLIEKKRLIVSLDPEEWIGEALEMVNFRLVPLSPTISYKSTTLPNGFHNDPADQIIVATAREENATIITKDSLIQNYPHVKTTW